jgi:hypothetical protein
MPVVTVPMPPEILYTLVTLAGSRSLSGTFFWVIITAAVADFTPIAVVPAELIALKAYSGLAAPAGGWGEVPTW